MKIKMSEKYWSFIKDPIHGYVQITENEKDVIDTKPVQRLRRIRQLSGSEYVYPGASHSRFEHSLGVMYLARMLCENLPIELRKEDIESVTFAGLLHDVGHGPFSHNFEPLLVKHLDKTHEDLTRWVIEKSELADKLESAGCDPEEVSKLAVGELNRPNMNFLDQVIQSTVDVDKMDFIVRDSYHTGAEFGCIDVSRLIYTMGVLEGDLAVNITSLPSLEAFILGRLESFRAIYFHKTVRAVQIMLSEALEKANQELGFTSFSTPEEYVSRDDYTTWTDLKRCEASKPLIENIEKRRLLKCAYERLFFTREKIVTSLFTNDKVRKQMEQEIAIKAKVDPDTVWIDVPSLPSVPYYHSIEVEPMEIPLFQEALDGRKISVKLDDFSHMINAFQVFMNILRVYTKSEFRERVGQASRSIFEGLPTEAKVSF